MTERTVDAAFSDGSQTGTFFLTNQYVVYDYVTSRVRDGIHSLTEFPPGSTAGFPAPFAPGGPETVVDAALRGKHAFEGRTYLFADGHYFRLVGGAVEPAVPIPVTSGWSVPEEFAFPTAAWNGALNRDQYCYFFHDDEYVRYLWADDKTDVGYPKPITNMIGIPPEFAGGVDGAVDGAAGFATRSYLFKDDEYLRFQWVSQGEPFADGGARKIQDGWTGLAEMLLAGKAKSHALAWLAEARGTLAVHAAGFLDAADTAVLQDAVDAHFKTTLADTASLDTITEVLGKIEATLSDSASFRFRTDAEAHADGIPAADDVPAAYASPTLGINITRAFPARAELNRVSSLLHEAVHVLDPASGTADVHISEWYVTPAEAARLGLQPVADMTVFATRYDLMSTADSLHNPSSYATFVRHLFFGEDSREVA